MASVSPSSSNLGSPCLKEDHYTVRILGQGVGNAHYSREFVDSGDQCCRFCKPYRIFVVTSPGPVNQDPGLLNKGVVSPHLRSNPAADKEATGKGFGR